MLMLNKFEITIISFNIRGNRIYENLVKDIIIFGIDLTKL